MNIEIGEIETVAHYKAAKKFQPNVDFILDIGGQDMKCIKIKNGAIDHLMLNEACSAGCGSFLESFAHSLHVPITEFANQALYAKAPVDLGSRCTVFMNSKVKQVQKEGVTLPNLSAGLSYSIIKNAIQKVMKLRNIESLGENIVVQGGTFYNEAVLRAFEQLIQKNVVRPDIAGIMGAYGSALIAKAQCQKNKQKSSLLDLAALEQFSYKTTYGRCGLCANHCPLTINHFGNKRTFITGNRCERGAGKPKTKTNIPNLFQYKYKRLFQYESLSPEQASRGKIGIPRVLNMYENYPLWHTIFTQLGYQVILSPKSSKKLYEKGMGYIPSESVCYPAKLTHGHISALVEEDVDIIFYPSVVYEKKEFEEATNHFNCPVVTSYPEVIRVNMDNLKEKNIPLIQPFITLNQEKAVIHALTEQFPEIPKKEIIRAVKTGWQEAEKAKQDIQKKGEETLQYLKETGMKGIVLAGRPYHVDPEINHGIAELISAHELAVLTEDSIAHLADTIQDPRVVNQWTYHARLYRAARVVAKQKNLELVQLTSFGCGLDAVTSDMVQEILEENNKMYTLIKIDEINNLGAARIRIRSLKAAMLERENKNFSVEKSKQPKPAPVFEREMKDDYTILIPQMSPFHFELYEALLSSEGYRVKLLETVSSDAIDTGLQFVNNDACYPAIVTIGQMVHALQSGDFDLNKTAVIMSQTGGACRATNYIALLRRALKDAGMGQIPVISLNAIGLEKHPGFELSYQMIKKLIATTVYGDALMRMVYRLRPHEVVKGSVNTCHKKWIEICKQSLIDFSYNKYKKIIEDASVPVFLNNDVLYDSKNVEEMLSYVTGKEYNSTFKITDNISATLIPNAHLLGAASILVTISYENEDPIYLYFSGDYSPNNRLFDVEENNSIYNLPINIVQESTYGKTSKDTIEYTFRKYLLNSIKNKETCIIPVFSQGRAQEIPYELKQMQQEGLLDTSIPIFADGKLSYSYTNFYLNHSEFLKKEVKNFLPENFNFVKDNIEREKLLTDRSCKIILTTSGMGNYGPAQTYLPYYISRPKCSIIFCGYTTPDSLG